MLSYFYVSFKNHSIISCTFRTGIFSKLYLRLKKDFILILSKQQHLLHPIQYQAIHTNKYFYFFFFGGGTFFERANETKLKTFSQIVNFLFLNQQKFSKTQELNFGLQNTLFSEHNVWITNERFALK